MKATVLPASTPYGHLPFAAAAVIPTARAPAFALTGRGEDGRVGDALRCADLRAARAIA